MTLNGHFCEVSRRNVEKIKNAERNPSWQIIKRRSRAHRIARWQWSRYTNGDAVDIDFFRKEPDEHQKKCW